MKLLLFSDAAQSHWKLQPGFVVAITNADMAEDNKSASTSVGNKLLTLKLTRDLQVLSLGLCPDYGTCTVSLFLQSIFINPLNLGLKKEWRTLHQLCKRFYIPSLCLSSPNRGQEAAF